jgi:hypothetical protein
LDSTGKQSNMLRAGEMEVLWCAENGGDTACRGRMQQVGAGGNGKVGTKGMQQVDEGDAMGGCWGRRRDATVRS